MAINLLPVEQDLFSCDDKLVRYRRWFRRPAETGVGCYAPGDKDDPENRADWKVWYRIESLPVSASYRT